VVSEPNTVIDPGAVMVETLHAVPAHGAMPTAARADGRAVRAQLRAIYLLEHVPKVDIFVFEVAWGCARGL